MQSQYSELQTKFNDLQQQQQQALAAAAAAAAGTPFSSSGTPPPAKRLSGGMTTVTDQMQQLPVSTVPGQQEDSSMRALATSGSTDALMMPKAQPGQPVHRAKVSHYSSNMSFRFEAIMLSSLQLLLWIFFFAL